MNRILIGNWNIQRLLYLIMGILVVIQSLAGNHWIGLIFGLYFSSMAIFNFGCASGNCNIDTKK